MALINCETILILAWSANYLICKVGRPITFAITDLKR